MIDIGKGGSKEELRTVSPKPHPLPCQSNMAVGWACLFPIMHLGLISHYVPDAVTFLENSPVPDSIPFEYSTKHCRGHHPIL